MTYRVLHRVGILAIVALAIAQSGCANSRYNIFHPGTVRQQQMRASVHDPYPDQDLGPEVVGGRPREFAQPLPEPVRNRFFTDSWWGR